MAMPVSINSDIYFLQRIKTIKEFSKTLNSSELETNQLYFAWQNHAILKPNFQFNAILNVSFLF